MEVLSSADLAEWRGQVGLSKEDPSRLYLITDDSLCQRIWNAVNWLEVAPSTAFFQLENRYIVADLWSDQIIVADEHFNLINPILSHFWLEKEAQGDIEWKIVLSCLGDANESGCRQ